LTLFEKLAYNEPKGNRKEGSVMQTIATIPWPEIRQRFMAWWRHEEMDSPLMHIVVRLDEPDEPLEPEPPFARVEQRYLDVAALVARRRNFYRRHHLLAEAYPQLSLDLGPGSLALYLGSEPTFAESTVWFEPCVAAADDWPALQYDPDNPWLCRHLDLFRQAKELVRDEFWLNMPDLIENIDILAALRGTQSLIYDMMDEPELIAAKIREVDALYFRYFDAFYDRVQIGRGNTYTAFNIWGPGRTAKVQCDFSALMSPAQFTSLVVPTLRLQCRQLDQSLYHLDGPDAIKHVPALMTIDELDALQWTCGAGQPDGAHDRWLPIYDQVFAAGKSVWIQLYDGGPPDWLAGARKLIARYSRSGLYFNFPPMSPSDGAMILAALR
jgi:5-methyltetrahydrofolate--homocysteine methyltransferase